MGKIEHFWEQLPGPNWFNAQQVYRGQVERASDGALFVELGAWKGRSTVFMAVEIANSGKNIRFYTVDTWKGIEKAEHYADPDVQAGTLYETFLENIAPVRNYVHPIRSLSADAASIFGDESVDFVFVDAGHTRQDVTSDLKAWWPKLVAGGVMAGDDWNFEQSSGEFGVRRAVRGFFNRPSCFYHIRLLEGYSHPHWTQWLVRKEGTTFSNLMAKLTTSRPRTGSSP